MKIISIGNDPKLFEAKSSVAKRQIEYGVLFEELHVFSRMGNGSTFKLSSNVFVYPLSRLFGEIPKISRTDGCVVSTQDPFEHGLIGVWLKLRYGLPLHVQLHTDFNNKYFILSSPLNLIRFFLAYLVLPYADMVRVVSKKVKESIKDFNKNIEVLPIRVEPVFYVNVPKNPFSVLTVARLEREKDLRTAIEAFALASSKYPQAIFTIAGEGSQKRVLKLQVKRLGLGDRVRFVGWVNDPQKLYAENQIYISTSLFEGYGMSIVEAAEAGCVLVLSDAGIAGEFTAFVSKPKDIKGFACSLEKLFGDRELIKKMGDQAKIEAQKIKIYSEDYFAKYKMNIESAGLGYKKKGFFGRLWSLSRSLFVANKILRFLFGGTAAALTQIFSLYFFTEVFNIWYLYSSILSFCIAFVVSFSLQKFWVFQSREVKGTHIQFFKYIIVVCLGIALNTLIMYMLVTIFGLWYILAQIISGMIIAVFNFLSYKTFIFKR